MQKRILLVFLHLTGWHISTCLYRQYHYVTDAKNWTMAQTYCRQRYKDLATIDNMVQMNQLRNIVSSTGNDAEIWIGLYAKIAWMWSDRTTGRGAEYRNWENNTNEPDFYGARETCVSIGEDGGWQDEIWIQEYPFICNNGTQLEPEFVLVDEAMDWGSAQACCSQNFTSLVTVKNDIENQMVQSLVPSGDRAWIGLSRPNWFFWSDQSRFNFGYFDNVANPIDSMKVMCGVLALKSSGKFRFLSCETSLPFVCYNFPPPVKQQIIKLRLNPGSSALDLNDPIVKSEILKKFQLRLNQQGVSFVTLTWREQPHKLVFQKEET
uniref:C-type lectin domain-containing protein n=1 Tax=Astatotilapia calliptera TaxID=8154 RepID=A0A3P8NWG4_ASTCA